MTTTTIEAKKVVLGAFEVVSLGIETNCYFCGFGSEGYNYATYGVGDTEEEALADCMEMMAQAAGFDFDETIEAAIRAEYGETDDSTTVADELGCEEEEEDDDWGSGVDTMFHVGIRWNEVSADDNE